MQLVIARAVTPEGLPLAYELLPGNTRDNATLRDFLDRIEYQYGEARLGKSKQLTLMRPLDELYTTYSFLGSRRMTGMLRAEGLRINRKRVQRLMRSTTLGPKAAHHQAHTRR